MPLRALVDAARKQWRSSALRSCVVLGVVFLAKFLFAPATVEAVIEMRSTIGSEGEIFFAGAGQAYDSERRVSFEIHPNGKWRKYRVRLPESQRFTQLRIDPGAGEGEFSIRRIQVRAPGNVVSLSGKELAAARQVTHGLRAVPSEDSELTLATDGEHSFVGFSLPREAGISLPRLALRASRGGLSASLGWMLLDLAASLLLGWLWTRRRLRDVGSRICAMLSDDGVVRVEPPVAAFLAFSVLAAITYVGLALNQSSLGVWEEMWPARPVEQAIDLGQAKHIRSDEWDVTTPWILGQVSHGQPVSSENVGGESAPLFASQPARHSSAIVQVKFFGFYLFDMDTGYSWYWAYKTFGLALSMFWLLLILTRGSFVAALIGMAWVQFSSFVQWWFSISMPEMVTGFALTTVGAIYVLFAQRRAWMAIGVALLGYGICTLGLHIYPAFIIPLAYLGVFIVAALLLAPDAWVKLRTDFSWRIGSLAVGLVPVALLAADYLAASRTTMTAMMNTVYPGRRYSASGGIPWYRLFYGFFEVFRFDEHANPLPPTNASEASTFIILAPLVLVVLRPKELLARNNRLLLALLAYCALVMSWIAIQLPVWLERPLQVGGWSFVPPFRAIIGLGIGTVAVITCLFARQQRERLQGRVTSAPIHLALAVFTIVWLYGETLALRDPAFFTWQVVLAGALVAALISTGATHGFPHLFAAGIALASVATVRVNPLVSGISSLMEKPVFVEAKRQGGGAHDKWAVIGDGIFAQGLKAHGLHVLNGVQMLPVYRLHAVLDPTNSSASIWNRYAHIALYSSPAREHPGYSLVGQDVYTIELDVCGEELRKLGVTHLAYTDTAPPEDAGIELYRLR